MVSAVFFLSLLAWFSLCSQVYGLDCQDTSPECERNVTPEICDQPGIAPACSRTCHTCEANGNQCATGYVEQRNRCRTCGSLTLQEIFQSRECPQDCPQNKWGRNCSRSCTPSCFRGCEKWSGQCLGGCKNGFYGNHCDLHCENCGGNGQCRIDGTCKYGCKSGFHGNLCSQHTEILR
ncbi:cell death abnormality protein 1-like [Haliotis asinina]|uniref:cell death abnormality protein 1-like n=1 Tax=Haliotis asinina TaxID=109174 RepID=UPI003531ABAD